MAVSGLTSALPAAGRRRPGDRPRRGMTLIELVITMAVMVMLMSIAIPVVTLFGSGQGLRTEAERLRSDFLQCKDYAASRRRTVFLTLEFDAALGRAVYRMEAETEAGNPSSRQPIWGTAGRREVMEGIYFCDAAGVPVTGQAGTGLIVEIRFAKTGECLFDQPAGFTDVDLSSWTDADPFNDAGELYLTDGSRDLMVLNIGRSNSSLQFRYLEGKLP